MRFGIIVSLVSVVAASAQVSMELRKAREEAEQVRLQVDAGVVPRARLIEVEEKIADAEDDEILRQTLYGTLTIEDLTEQQAAEMIAAAERRAARQQHLIEKTKLVIEAGAAAQVSIAPYQEELDRRRKAVDLAHTRAGVLREIAAMAQREQEAQDEREERSAARSHLAAVRYDGDGEFSNSDLAQIMADYRKRFRTTLPVSAHGMTAVHRSMGFDHRGRVDVALNPDQREGEWLLAYLERERIPYFAFRRAIAGSATAPHIHIGTPSPRLMAD